MKQRGSLPHVQAEISQLIRRAVGVAREEIPGAEKEMKESDRPRLSGGRWKRAGSRAKPW